MRALSQLAPSWPAEVGCRPELAWTDCDYADLLLSRDAPGDGERAAALLDEALALAQEMGMRPPPERLQARRHG